jgi:acyl-coenzyme A synthetase/AMP-(fatty) acid ligase/thioesterase domain-containing protein/acyl carrier protein
MVTDPAHAERAVLLQGDRDVVLVGDAGAVAPTEFADRPSVDVHAPATASLTSATTGEAKAVLHPHRNVVTNAVRYATANAMTTNDRILVIGPLGAQAAATQIFTALLTGATLLTYDIRRFGAPHLTSFAQANGATTVHLPPAAVSSLPAGMRLPDVRLVSLGGDRVTHQQLLRVREMFPNATLLQRYSTSETNSIAGWRLEPGAPLPDDGLPALEPVPWAGVRVIGDDGHPVAVGDIGEVEITGAHVALGYLDDPERTAERFTTPTGDGRVRTYRTGDRARLLPGGRLELLGRVDDVCKVRGVLVDPAAVERALEAMPEVSAAAVVARVVDGRTDLVAFVVVPVRGVHGWQLRAALTERVPPALVPATVRIIDALPTTARNKVDRAALRELAAGGAGGSGAGESPMGELEQRIAGVFATVLGAGPTGTFGRHHDVFDAGADSLAVIEILTRLERVLGHPVSPSTLFGAPTAAGLADRLQGVDADETVHGVVDGLVRVRTGDPDRTPVVVFTGGGGGHLSGPALLAQRLDRRTVYAVVPHGFERRVRADRKLAAMGARSAGAIRALGHERIVIVGHSSGGNVAIEAARHLFGGPVEVEVVVLLDSLAMTPRVIRRRRFGWWLRWELRRERDAAGPRSRVAAGRAVVRVTARFTMKRVRQWWWANTAGVLPRDRAAQHKAFEAVVRRALRRRPEQPYGGDVVLVRADGATWPDLPEDLRWSEVGLGSLAVDHAGGPHDAMLTERHVGATAAAVERACARVRGER